MPFGPVSLGGSSSGAKVTHLVHQRGHLILHAVNRPESVLGIVLFLEVTRGPPGQVFRRQTADSLHLRLNLLRLGIIPAINDLFASSTSVPSSTIRIFSTIFLICVRSVIIVVVVAV